MTIYKVAELTGRLLDAAVAIAGGADHSHGTHAWYWPESNGQIGWLTLVEEFNPSTNWGQSGPIIQREQIVLSPSPVFEIFHKWQASIKVGDQTFRALDESPLVAAMRAYVASKFGDTVELP